MRKVAMALAFAALPAAPSHAQSTPLPGAVQPGQIERQFEPRAQPRATPPPIEVPAAGQDLPAQAHSVRVQVREVEVDGLSVYPAAALREHFAPVVGREVALAEIYALAQTLTARFRNDGYILSQVVVPAQTIADGVVRLQAIEGYIGAVRVEGGSGGDAQRVAAHLEAIRSARPLTAAALERQLLLLNDLPGVLARATLLPSPSQPGAADLLVRLSHRPLGAGVQIDNRGSEALGPWRLSADVEARSALGRDERIALRAVTTANRELDYLAASYEQPLGADGLRLSASLAAVEARPQPGARLPVDIATSSRSGALGASYPLWRGRSRNLTLRAALSAHDSETGLASIRNSRDRLRALRIGAEFDRADAWRGITLVDLEFAQGIDGLGATRSGTPGLSRAEGRSDFAKLELYLARLQSIAPRWSVLAALSAQHAFTDLLSAELYAFGGEQFGRGYDPSELVGDSGAALKLELRYAGSGAGDWLPAWTAYGFWDLGGVRRRTPINEEAAESAASAGAGVRFEVGAHLSGYVEAAKPLTRPVAAEGDRDARVFVGLAARF